MANEKENYQYKVGDRIRCVALHDDYSPYIKNGDTGTIVSYYPNFDGCFLIMKVEWDEKTIPDEDKTPEYFKPHEIELIQTPQPFKVGDRVSSGKLYHNRVLEGNIINVHENGMVSVSWDSKNSWVLLTKPSNLKLIEKNAEKGHRVMTEQEDKNIAKDLFKIGDRVESLLSDGVNPPGKGTITAYNVFDSDCVFVKWDGKQTPVSMNIGVIGLVKEDKKKTAKDLFKIGDRVKINGSKGTISGYDEFRSDFVFVKWDNGMFTTAMKIDLIESLEQEENNILFGLTKKEENTFKGTTEPSNVSLSLFNQGPSMQILPKRTVICTKHKDMDLTLYAKTEKGDDIGICLVCLAETQQGHVFIKREHKKETIE